MRNFIIRISSFGCRFAFAALFACSARADRIVVAQDREDGLYRCGETASFSVSVCDDAGRPLTVGKADWTLDNFGLKSVAKGTADLSAANPFVVRGTLQTPDFLRLKVRAGTNSVSWSVGYDVAAIRQNEPAPADFDAYWRGEQARLAKTVPLDATCELDPVRSKDRPYETHLIGFATFNGTRVWGFMTIPRDRSRAPFATRVRVCDAGYGAWDTWEPSSTEVVVTLNVFDFKPGRTLEENKALVSDMSARWAARHGLKKGTFYSMAGMGTGRDDYIFHDAMLGLDRAVDWVAQRPEVDPSRIYYIGSSQGGGFGLYLNYLNSHFARACFIVPACTGHYGYKQSRQSGWPQLVKGQPTPEKVAVAEKYAGYYDGVNFAAGIRHPVRFVVGFADETCPPADVYSAYNICPAADKGIVNCIGSGHGGTGKWIKANRGKPSWLDCEAWLHERL